MVSTTYKLADESAAPSFRERKGWKIASTTDQRQQLAHPPQLRYCHQQSIHRRRHPSSDQDHL